MEIFWVLHRKANIKYFMKRQILGYYMEKQILGYYIEK